MWFLITFISCEFSHELSGDGLQLTIKGTGIINSAIARKKGSYKMIEKVTVVGADELDDGAFSEFAAVKEIVLPSVMTRIGKECFKECRKLTSIVIPEGVDSIQTTTFFNCMKLEFISIPKSLKTIDTTAVFAGITKATIFEINDLNQYFSTDPSKQYLMSKDGTILYKGPSNSDCIIPSSVKIITKNFCYTNSLKSISFAKDGSVELIKNYAFRQEYIDELILPSSIKILEAEFFVGEIKRITIPNSLEKFDTLALNMVTGLTEFNIFVGSKLFQSIDGIIYDFNITAVIFIPPNMKNITFSSALSTIAQKQVLGHGVEWATINGWSDVYQSYEGILYKNKFASVYACPGGLKHAKIISNCTSISYASFSNCLVETVELSDGLKRIDNEAFLSCTQLRSINIPSKLEKIGSWCFTGCENLSIHGVFPASLQQINRIAFRSTKFDILDMSQCVLMDTIYDQSFSRCQIGTLILPPQLQIIEEEAFYSTTIESVEIPPSVQTINENSFSSCLNLKSITFKELSNSVLNTLGLNAFSNTAIEEIELPASLKIISEGAFKSCKKLNSIKLNGPLKSIGFEVIHGCESLTKFVFDYDVEEIAEGAFAGASGLLDFEKECAGKYTVNEGILFSDNGKTLFAFPAGRSGGAVRKSVEQIGAMAFRECIKLTDLKFETDSTGNGVSWIGPYTFYKCTKLSSISIPSSAKIIETNAFSGCSSLQKVTIGSSTSKTIGLQILNVSLFEGCVKLREFQVSVPGLKTVGSRCLFGCTSLSSISLPSSVESIEASAFDGCKSLTKISLDGVKQIGERAFGGCTSLASLFIGSRLEQSAASSFAGCSSLATIFYCGLSTTAIPNGVFADAKSANVIVRSEFAGSTVGGLVVLKVLDQQCNIPTAMFSGAFQGTLNWAILGAESIIGIDSIEAVTE